jgi:gas vesicle protein
MSTGKVLLGVLLGTAIGAIAGILFAPDKGTATRKKIYQKGDDYVGEVGDKFNAFIESVAHRFEELKAETARMAETGLEKAEAALTDTAAAAQAKIQQQKEAAANLTKN